MSLRRWTAIIGVAALIGLIALSTGLAFAADLAIIPRHSHHHTTVAPKPDTETQLEEFATGANAGCTAWTDGCRSCGKGPSGVFCSNVGIACQPSQPQCTRH
jgi:hypothetical protein